jgi:hypothetical protein
MSKYSVFDVVATRWRVVGPVTSRMTKRSAGKSTSKKAKREFPRPLFRCNSYENVATVPAKVCCARVAAVNAAPTLHSFARAVSF